MPEGVHDAHCIALWKYISLSFANHLIIDLPIFLFPSLYFPHVPKRRFMLSWHVTKWIFSCTSFGENRRKDQGGTICQEQSKSPVEERRNKKVTVSLGCLLIQSHVPHSVRCPAYFTEEFKQRRKKNNSTLLKERGVFFSALHRTKQVLPRKLLALRLQPWSLLFYGQCSQPSPSSCSEFSPSPTDRHTFTHGPARKGRRSYCGLLSLSH